MLAFTVQATISAPSFMLSIDFKSRSLSPPMISSRLGQTHWHTTVREEANGAEGKASSMVLHSIYQATTS